MTELPRCVVFGEALTDMIRGDDGRWQALPGGSCWNVARVAARLGVPTGFAGAISCDLFGDALWTASQAAGLDLRFTQRLEHAPLLSIVASTHPPSYFFIGANSADLYFDPAQLPVGWRDAVEVVHFGGISLAREPLARRLVSEAQALRRAGRAIAFDPNMRTPMQHAGYREVFLTMVAMARYIKVSQEDLESLFPRESEDDAIGTLRSLAPAAHLLVTRGEAGMTLVCGDLVLDQAACVVEVVDTVGCGDAAMGAWIATVLREPAMALADRLRLVASAAALAAGHAGPYAPSLAEVAQLA